MFILGTITLSSNNEDYKIQCVKISLSFLNSLEPSKIITMSNILKELDAIVLSRMSQLNRDMEILLSNIVDVVKDNYIDACHNNIEDLNLNGMSSDKITEFQRDISDIREQVVYYSNIVKGMYDIDDDNLSIYSKNEVEGGVNFRYIEDTSPDVFKYYEGKLVMNDLISFLHNISSKGTNYNKFEVSSHATFIDRANTILSEYTNNLNNLIIEEAKILQMIDSCNLAIVIWNSVCVSSKTKLSILLQQNFSNILSDILKYIA